MSVRLWTASSVLCLAASLASGATAPVLTAPQTTASPNPTYRWNAVAGADSYELWVKRGNATVVLQTYAAATACVQTECAATPSAELRRDAYAWLVQAVDATGGAWSAPMTFRVEDPLAPTLLTPSGSAGGPRPTYAWQTVAHATHYYLRVDGPGGPLVQNWFTSASICSSSACLVTPAIDHPLGSFRWWVRAANNAGGGPSSAPRAFTITSGGTPTPTPPPGTTLFVTTLLPENGAVTGATGYSTLILAADERSALVSANFSNLSSTEIAAHVHGIADPGQSAPALFSVPLGNFTDAQWVFQPTGNVTIQQQIDALRTGRIYINIHTSNYPNGEIRGHYRPATGGGTPTPTPTIAPTPTPTPTAGPPFSGDAVRFLQQASWGANTASIDRVRTLGFDGWIEEQFNLPPSGYFAHVNAAPTTNDDNRMATFQARFFGLGIAGPDQLRQRVGWALSQILVVSGLTIPDGPGMAIYVDLLNQNAFGNYRQLLRELTLNPAMGDYLDMVNNRKPNPTTGRIANENYAREILQLFSVGLFRLNADGTLALDGQGRPIPTYDEAVIQALARVFTGWTYAPKPGQPNNTSNPVNYLAPMVLHQINHDVGAKTILGGVVLPAGRDGNVDLDEALDVIANHPNVGPFIGRQLIQQLVTSNPSPAYVARITTVFNNNGAGVRGDLRAVVKAILLDSEARGATSPPPPFGKLKEPTLAMLQLVRALNGTGDGLGLAGIARNMGQDPYQAPSVFNYFTPDYQLPGTALFAPPFQIHTEATTVTRSNWVNTLIFGTVGVPFGPTGTSVAVDLAQFDALAANPATLVDALDQRLTHGAMSAGMKATIVDAVGRISATRARARVQNALYLVATSAQFNVGR